MIFTLGKGRKTILQLYLVFPVCVCFSVKFGHSSQPGVSMEQGGVRAGSKTRNSNRFCHHDYLSTWSCSSSSSKSGFKKSEREENAVGAVGDWAKAPKSILSQAVERSSHYRWLLSLSSSTSSSSLSSLSLSSTSSSSSNRPASSYSIYSSTLAPSFGLSVIISQLYWQQGRYAGAHVMVLSELIK